ncbi:MAG: FAD-dependent oxidoreductase [Deltaproteobacteria bacterium]|nr:FAD-dependent oxidoreductase [Deltaproteobacteria bacterium]
MQLPFTEGSFWLEPPVQLAPRLEGDLRCDVAVVGGGITGMCAALRLAERGVDVALVEAEFCGAGASGRNAGHVTPTIGKDIVSVIRQAGRERGARLIRFAERAVEFWEETIASRGIECEYVRSGNVVAGVHPRHREPLRKSAELARELGVKASFLDEAAMRARGLPPAFRFGVLEGCGGHMHPGKYGLGLRRALLASGARVFEQTPVQTLQLRSEPRVETAGGSLRARKLLLCTNAYTPVAFRLLRHKMVPARVHQFITRPLTSAERDSLGWRGGEAIYTAHEILENYRITADGRVVGGSKDVNVAFGNRLPEACQPDSFRLIERAFRERFPTLSGVPIERYWGGYIAITLDFLPVHGALAGGQALYYGGCNGHGVPTCTLMGATLADEALGEKAEIARALDRFELPWPPEPLRWLGGQALLWYLRRADRRVDDELRAGA